LGQAAKQALVFAASIAAGLGTKVGPVISAQQGASYTPVDVPGAVAAAATTPIQSGTVGVSATVTVVVQQTQ